MTVAQAARPLRLAIHNQVNYHLHVVAGAMRVLQPLTSAPITVFLSSKVIKENWYGFMDWLGGQDGFVWKECSECSSNESFDFIWFISPEFDLEAVSAVSKAMQPALQLFYIHNGHMPDQDFDQLVALSRDMPLVGMAPHVAKYVAQRLQQCNHSQLQQLDSISSEGTPPLVHGAHRPAPAADWLLPIWPFEPKQQEQQHSHAAEPVCSFKGFSITGSLDKSLRNYSKMWEQIRSYRDREGEDALVNFKLNILGDVLAGFTVPEDLQQYVELYKTPPDEVFYDVIYHSCGIVPALANPAYYTCKLTSAVISTLMTGVPVLADAAFLGAYTMLSPQTVFEQRSGEDELDAMFRVARLPSKDVWRTRSALLELRQEMNSRCVELLLGWLRAKGLQPDPASAVVQQGQ